MSKLSNAFHTRNVVTMSPSDDELLTSAFRYYRQRPTFNAQRALGAARKDVAERKNRYPRSNFAMRGGADWKIGSDTVFFCEQPDDYLRRVGFVDEIPSESHYRGKMVDHKGWYLRDDDSGGEVARGVVFQLPAHKGKCRYLSAVADPHNNGPAILSLELFDELSEAARNADSLAETYAETERDYNRAWEAGQRYSDLGAEIAEQRKTTLALIREAKSQCATLRDMPATRKVIESAIRDYLRETESARDKRAELISEFGDCDAFKETAEG
ncbi:hypothetical protein [Bradyrhizobium sp. 150]|uniref:hypothetical protein n=1 Tax=Bradyrhizobium sp. 150 TaxID=2782625 RepID=UPI001FF8060D|nr:hypothetical protein [Bradyrhizobium sp. 150]MCK1671097.1 hypothetical protein [Bradyrhizobium sp. 150]